jgi:diacylglycerol kinase (ATP)
MPSPPRSLVIVNPVAGGGRARRAVPTILATLERTGVISEVQYSRHPGDAEDLARRAAAEGLAPVIGVGGDGTLQEIVNGLLTAADPPPLGIVPAGSGNDFARGLGLPLAARHAAALIAGARAVAVDLGRSGGRYYLNVAGVGFDAEVAAAVARGGRWRYLAATVRNLWRYRNQPLVVHVDGEVVARRALLVAVANGPCYAGGMRICPDARPSDGLLDVCVIGDVTRLEILRLLPGVFFGRHARHPKVEFRRSRVVRIEGPPGTRAHVDGESCGTVPVEFRAVPAALRVLGATVPAPLPTRSG